MVSKSHNSGYTIIEVMIVLAISAAIFAGAITGFITQNRRTAFNQAVKDLEIRIQDVLNDVGTGYYPNSGNFTCSRGGPNNNAHVVIDDTQASPQGSNEDCIFLGKAFDPLRDVSDNTLEIYNLFGLKNSKTDIKEVSASLDDANAIWVTNIQGFSENYNLNRSIQIKKILVGDGTSSDESDGFALVSGFGGGERGGSGATTNQVSISSFQTLADGSWTTQLNQPITLCIEESGGGSSARHATIKLGTGSKLSVETNMDDWPAGCT